MTLLHHTDLLAWAQVTPVREHRACSTSRGLPIFFVLPKRLFPPSWGETQWPSRVRRPAGVAHDVAQRRRNTSKTKFQLHLTLRPARLQLETALLTFLFVGALRGQISLQRLSALGRRQRSPVAALYISHLQRNQTSGASPVMRQHAQA